MKYQFIKGSIFDLEESNIEALIIFIPSGLTSLRPETMGFIETKLDYQRTISEFSIYKFKSDSNQIAIIKLNNNNKTLNSSEASTILQSLYQIIKEFKITSLAMNGIRLNNHLFSEKWLWEQSKNWELDYIAYIDKRGGFNKIII